MRFDAFLAAPLHVQAHALAAIGALVLGLSLYTVARGRLAHRTLGLSMAALLVITLLTAFFIRTDGGAMSWIHGFIPLTLLGLFGIAMGVAGKDWQRHKNAGRGLIFGTLLIPALFTLMPGRLLHQVFFG
ncbi:MAG: hypothetical protein AAFR33_01935 [Pseudomonadota bacterium]